MTTAHALDVLFDSAASGDEVVIPEGWGQGRATFGGLITGLLLARGMSAFGLEAGQLRAATTSFVGPATAGPARVSAELLRRGRSAAQIEVRLHQHDERSGAETVRAVLLAAFGAGRDSSVEVVPAPAGDLPDRAALTPVPFIPGLTPDFFAHVDVRVASGGVPFSAAPTGDLTGYMAYREPPRELTVPLFVALVDAWPPAPGAMLTGPAGMSTLTWTIELLAEPAGAPDAPWWYEVTTDAAHRGYGHTHARVYDASGTLVAISRQSVTLFG